MLVHALIGYLASLPVMRAEKYTFTLKTCSNTNCTNCTRTTYRETDCISSSDGQWWKFSCNSEKKGTQTTWPNQKCAGEPINHNELDTNYGKCYPNETGSVQLECDPTYTPLAGFCLSGGKVLHPAPSACMTTTEAANVCTHYTEGENVRCQGFWWSENCDSTGGKYLMNFNSEFNPSQGDCNPPLTPILKGPGSTPSAVQPVYHYFPGYRIDQSFQPEHSTLNQDVLRAEEECGNSSTCHSFTYQMPESEDLKISYFDVGGDDGGDALERSPNVAVYAKQTRKRPTADKETVVMT